MDSPSQILFSPIKCENIIRYISAYEKTEKERGRKRERVSENKERKKKEIKERKKKLRKERKRKA